MRAPTPGSKDSEIPSKMQSEGRPRSGQLSGIRRGSIPGDRPGIWNKLMIVSLMRSSTSKSIFQQGLINLLAPTTPQISGKGNGELNLIETARLRYMKIPSYTSSRPMSLISNFPLTIALRNNTAMTTQRTISNLPTTSLNIRPLALCPLTSTSSLNFRRPQTTPHTPTQKKRILSSNHLKTKEMIF